MNRRSLLKSAAAAAVAPLAPLAAVLPEPEPKPKQRIRFPGNTDGCLDELYVSPDFYPVHDVRVWHRVLTPEEIEAIHRGLDMTVES